MMGLFIFANRSQGGERQFFPSGSARDATDIFYPMIFISQFSEGATHDPKRLGREEGM
jgi:hypothetical protein